MLRLAKSSSLPRSRRQTVLAVGAPSALGSEPTIDLDAAAGVLGQAQSAPSEGSTLHEQHRARVYATYIECHRNVSETARQLGVSRNTIYRALAEQAREAPPGGRRVEVRDVRADKSR
jgi:DNA-binding NtrC family response regulator